MSQAALFDLPPAVEIKRRPSVRDAMAARDLGVKRAHERNERRNEGWSERAMGMMQAFVHGRETAFLAEDFLEFCFSCGLGEPTDRRALGAVMQRAQREEIIDAVGYAPARTSNQSPKVLWRRRETRNDRSK